MAASLDMQNVPYCIGSRSLAAVGTHTSGPSSNFAESMCRQLGCDEQQDILRPYSTINYAWDEPSMPHKLVLSLPGNRVLGVFQLDKVA